MGIPYLQCCDRWAFLSLIIKEIVAKFGGKVGGKWANSGSGTRLHKVIRLVTYFANTKR